MRILFVSKDLSGGDLCYRLKKEGNDVKLFVRDKDQRQNFEGVVTRVSNWKKQLKWVGKNGLIIFDSTGFGRDQDMLRMRGYSVIGGCELGDRMEDDRAFGKHILSSCGIHTVPSRSFRSFDEAILFLKTNPGEWVVKQNGHMPKILNYVGQVNDGSDVIEVLKLYRKEGKKNKCYIELQKRVRGVEIGVARYFNGNDWVGPIEMNIEHKDLCSGGLGPKTYEMGTLMWYADDENTTLFQKTLAKMQPYLREIGFRGDIDINCIVDARNVYPLEITARFGFPSTQLQSSLHISPWGEFLKAIADGKPYHLQYRRGYGIVLLLAIPPFPYSCSSKQCSLRGIRVLSGQAFSSRELSHIHYEEVSVGKDGHWYVSGKNGFAMHVSGIGSTVESARENAYALAEKIILPKKFYRTDIGQKFLVHDRALLEKWGYLKQSQ